MRRHPHRFAPLWLVGILLGCVTVSTYQRMARFDATAESYYDAIRWSDFETAGRFRKTDPGTPIPAEAADLNRRVQVTAYEIKEMIVSEDESRIRRTAEIRYYRLDKMVEKSLREQEIWEYDESINRWVLQGPFPAFD